MPSFSLSYKVFLFIRQIHTRRLELVNLLIGVAKLLQKSGNIALLLGANLRTRNGLHQSRRTADEKLDVFALGLGEDLLQQLLCDEATAADPVLGGLVQDVECAEALGVCVLELVKLALEQDVLLGDVSEDEGDLGLVVGVLEDCADELVHRGDAGAAGNESDVVVLVLGPGVLGKRALDVEGVADLEIVDVSAHGAVGVLLHQEVEEASLVFKAALLSATLVVHIYECQCYSSPSSLTGV